MCLTAVFDCCVHTQFPRAQDAASDTSWSEDQEGEDPEGEETALEVVCDGVLSNLMCCTYSFNQFIANNTGAFI